MKIVTTGGRGYDNDALVRDVLMALDPDVIAHGGADGADTLVAQHSEFIHHADTREFKADWKKHGTAAGPIRNRAMLDSVRPDLVIAFPGGRGTEDCIVAARERGIPVLRAEATNG